MNGIILICGDLCARRPGRATRKQPLPAERQRLGAISDFFFLTCVVWSAANTTGHREPVTERIRVSRGPALGGNWINVRLLNPARNLILGLGRALQPFQKPTRAFANALHLPSSLQNASASYEQEIIGAHGNARKAFGEIRNVEC